MGFLNKFFQKEKKQIVKIKEEDIEEILKKKIDSIWENNGFEAEKAKKRIEKAIDYADELSKLKEKEEKLDENKRLATISNSAKNNTCTIIKKELQFEFDSLKSFYVNGSPAIEKIGKATSKYGSRIEISFSSEYSKLLKILRDLSSYFKDFKDTAKNNLKKEEEFSNWLNVIEKYIETQKLLKNLNEQTKLNKESIVKKEKMLSQIEKEYSNLEKGDEFSNYKKAENELIKLQDEIYEIKRKYAEFTSNLEKPLIYYKNKLADPSTRRIIERILEEKGEFMGSRDSSDSTNDIFSKLSSTLQEMELNEKRKEKAMQTLEKFEQGHVENLFNSLEKISLLIKEKTQEKNSLKINEKMKKLESEKIGKEKEISEKRKELNSMNSRLQNKKEELKEIESEIQDIKTKLSNL